MEDITEDRVKTLTHEAINQRLDNFREIVCEPKHKQLKEDRTERGERIEKIDNAVDTLAKCMNGKFTKLYYFMLVLLASVITTFIAVLTK